MVTVKETQYKEFGKCIYVSNGIVEAVVSTLFGPRILRFSFVGGKNHLFEDHEGRAMASASTPEMDEYFGIGKTFHVYGGQRVWASPQSMPETFYPDNEPVNIEITDSGVIATSPKQDKNGFVTRIELKMAEDAPTVTVTSSLTNASDKAKDCAVWSVTAMAAGGKQIIPLATSPTKGTSNKHLALWPFSKMNDKRVCWLSKYITITQDSSYIDYDEFKVGVNNEAGYALHILGNECFKLSFEVRPTLKYYDDKIWYEGYTNNISSEMEVLGEYSSLLPGETKSVSATWTLIDNVLSPNDTDNDIDDFVKKLGL